MAKKSDADYYLGSGHALVFQALVNVRGGVLLVKHLSSEVNFMVYHFKLHVGSKNAITFRGVIAKPLVISLNVLSTVVVRPLQKTGHRIRRKNG